MRDRWDGESKSDLDEPVTITERQLRALRRGGRTGMLAILLALISLGVAGWSLLMGPEAFAGFEGIQNVRQRVLSAIGHPPAAEELQVSESPPDSLKPPEIPGVPDSMRGVAQPTVPSNNHAESRTAESGKSAGR
jgi:hypothetical protein